MQTNQLKWLLLLILSMIWGSSFILIKKGLVALSPLQVGSLRIIFAAIFLLIIGFGTLKNIPKSKWKYIALTSLFGTFIPAFLFAIAQKHISSVVSSILNSLTPLNTLLLGVLAFGIGFNRKQVVGVCIGLVGCLILILNGENLQNNQNYWYAGLIVIASICYATNVNLIQKHLYGLSPLTISTGNFTVLVLPAICILTATGFFNQIDQVAVQTSIMYILILGVIGTGVANIIFFKLIQISSPVFATSVTYLIPVVAFGWGFFDGETLTVIQFFGAFVILIGVYLSAKKQKKNIKIG